MTLFNKQLSSRGQFALALNCVLLGSTALTDIAYSQSAELPPIDVNATRLRGLGSNSSAGAEVAPAQGPATASDTNVAAPNNIGIVGASSSVITAEEIARSPGRTVQDILATLPGVQLTNLFGAVNGTNSVVDLRGFGPTASSNTLILLNGRRLNDADLQGVDLSTIPLQSIERIEVTRGNSGAVLYGDNAVGGVINIVTKTGVGAKPFTARIEGGVGSYGQRELNLSTTTNSGPWSTSTFENYVKSDGYRVNNALDQKNAIGEIRYTTQDLKAFFNVTGDDQHVGLPGGRTINSATGVNQFLTDPRGTGSPFDYAEKRGWSMTTGFTKSLWTGAELIVDGGVRDKHQLGAFFYSAPPDPSAASAVESWLQTWSITPRLSMKNSFGSITSNILTGIDYYDARYVSNRSAVLEAPPVDVYHIGQKSLAGYWQQTLGFTPSTDFSYGGRVQRNSLNATDTLDPNAPNYFGSLQLAPLDTTETNRAWHVGLEHRFNQTFTIFGRAASAFRVPNVDERIGATPFGVAGSFNLKTQTSHDVEGGIKIHGNGLDIQTSYYDMHLKNELHLDPVSGVNTNLDPSHRYGVETAATLRVNNDFRLNGALTYSRAVFEEGIYTGNDLPLTSRVSGSAGFSWNVWQRYVMLDVTARFWSQRRLDSDEANKLPYIPANATLDMKVSGEYDRFFWSVAINDLLDTKYYDYGVKSIFSPTAYSVYPLPGRTVMGKAGITF